MSDETVPEAAVATTTGEAKPPAGVFLPKSLAGVLVLVLALGVGFGIGRATGGDHHRHDRDFRGAPRAMTRGGPQRGRALPAPRNVPNLPNVPNTPNAPATPALPQGTAYLGLAIANATGAGGADVTAVASGSPAASAGFQVGDRITSVDGKAVTTSADLVSAIGAHTPGDTVALGYVRNGTAATVSVQLGNRTSANSTTPPTATQPALQMIN